MKFTTPILAIFLSVAAHAQQNQGEGFSLEVAIDTVGSGNEEIIGAHLHTGYYDVNGPVNIVFCGSSPLPSINGPCTLKDVKIQSNRMSGLLDVQSSMGAWSNGINNATAIANATTLVEGAPTTYDSFLQSLLNDCGKDSTVETCPVYFNFHTNASFAENPGFGLARSQLRMVDCPSGKPSNAYCFGTQDAITSENTNKVTGIQNTLPLDAGKAAPVASGRPIITFVPPRDLTESNSPTSAPTSGIRGSSTSPTEAPTSGAAALTGKAMAAAAGVVLAVMQVLYA